MLSCLSMLQRYFAFRRLDTLRFRYAKMLRNMGLDKADAMSLLLICCYFMLDAAAFFCADFAMLPLFMPRYVGLFIYAMSYAAAIRYCRHYSGFTPPLRCQDVYDAASPIFFRYASCFIFRFASFAVASPVIDTLFAATPMLIFFEPRRLFAAAMSAPLLAWSLPRCCFSRDAAADCRYAPPLRQLLFAAFDTFHLSICRYADDAAISTLAAYAR